MTEKRYNREIERLRDVDRLERLEVPRVVDLALQGLIQPQSMLDVGCGSGVFSEAFASRGLSVSGVDVNPLMLPAASEFVPAGDFRELAAESLPFDDGAFDLVFMGLLLHETDDPLAALKEARRVGHQRLAVLEWPDEDQPIGPPREDRIADARILMLAEDAGFTKVDFTRLKTLVLYRMEIRPF
jgi:ubiquinone/menaquinone biosynthesis C-methylase UbiE